MQNLTKEETLIIHGGNSAPDKERSSFDAAVDAIGGAVAGVAGVIISWFK